MTTLASRIHAGNRTREQFLNLLAMLILLALGILAPDADAASAAPGETTAGSLYLRAGANAEPIPALRVSTSFRATVTGSLARVEVSQRFTNPTDDWVEGLYVFPLSVGAAVDELAMQVGDRTIRGEIQPRAKARENYETAKREGRHASIVDQERPNLFKSAVANIGPRSSITVQISYLESLAFRDARYTLSLPLAITPRYMPGGRERAGEDSVGSAMTSELTSPPMQTVSIDVRLKPGFRLERVRSLHHAIGTQTIDGGREIVLKESIVPADHDFALEWAPAITSDTSAAAFIEHQGNEGYALLMLTPPDIVSEHAQRREVLFIIDTSGSMGGPSIEQARAALQLGVDRLATGDRFNVIRFSSDATRLFDRAVPVSDDSIERAHRFIRSLRADGGTEMRAALDLAFDTPAPEDALRQIVFITDGSVGNEAELVAMIRERLGSARLFTVGIGAAPNEYFMREAANAGRGSFTMIAETGEVRDRMDELFRKLERPALVNLELRWPDGAPVDLAAPMPADLYAGDPLMIVARLSTQTKGLLTLNGSVGGTPWMRQLMLMDVGTQAGIGKLWARERIGSLSRQKNFGGDTGTIEREILELAMRHHLVSEQTSLVAIDVTPVRPQGSGLAVQQAPTAGPAGGAWAQTAGFASTATPSPLLFVLGAILLVIAMLVCLV